MAFRTVDGLHWPPMSPVPGSAQSTEADHDFTGVVASLALILLGYPAIALTAPGVADPILLIVAVLLSPFILGQLRGLHWPVLWLSALIVVYALSSHFSDNSDQGFRHTLTLASLGAVFLTFAAYGSALLEARWFRLAATAVVTADVIAILAGGLPKNATGGALIYVGALAVGVLLARSGSSGWVGALAFTVLGLVLSYVLNFRFLLVCSLVFLLCFSFTTAFRTKGYWLAGLIGSASAIAGVLWFFLNLKEGGRAWDLGQWISEITGHRANSGRDEIWAYVLYAVQDNPLLGIGAGTLPRDFMDTERSAHSYYLQVFLQTGVVGEFLLACFLLSVWWVLARARSAAGRFGSAVFIMFVVHNATEVLMFQNNAIVAVPAWCCIGLAVAAERSQAASSKPNLPAGTKYMLVRDGSSRNTLPSKR